MKNKNTCCLCDSEFDDWEVKHIEIKGKVKDICKECVDSIKGFL